MRPYFVIKLHFLRRARPAARRGAQRGAQYGAYSWPGQNLTPRIDGQNLTNKRRRKRFGFAEKTQGNPVQYRSVMMPVSHRMLTLGLLAAARLELAAANMYDVLEQTKQPPASCTHGCARWDETLSLPAAHTRGGEVSFRTPAAASTPDVHDVETGPGALRMCALATFGVLACGAYALSRINNADVALGWVLSGFA